MASPVVHLKLFSTLGAIMDSPAATELQPTDWGVSGLGKITLFPCRIDLLCLVLSQTTPIMRCARSVSVGPRL